MNNNFDMIPLYGKITCKDSGGGGGVTPSGTKEITIKENGNFLHDVSGYAAASIDVDVPIPDGYIIPSGTKEIVVTENGTIVEDIAQYESASISVNVDNSSELIDELLSPTGSMNIDIDSNVASVTASAMQGEKSVKSVKLNNATKIDTNAFYSCSNLESLYAPEVTYIGNGAFKECSELSEIYLPKVKTIYGGSSLQTGSAFYNCAFSEADLPSVLTIGHSAFYLCSNIETLNAPNCTSISNASLALCPSLKKVVLGAAPMNADLFYSGPGSTYYGMSSTPSTCEILDIVGETSKGINLGYIPEGIKHLIIRNTSGIVPNIDSTDYKSKFTQLKIFVPYDLLNSYRVATNWTLYSDKFYALEDYDVVTG